MYHRFRLGGAGAAWWCYQDMLAYGVENGAYQGNAVNATVVQCLEQWFEVEGSGMCGCLHCSEVAV
jgi:hypothetical protein